MVNKYKISYACALISIAFKRFLLTKNISYFTLQSTLHP